jgi:hypothetical protein
MIVSTHDRKENQDRRLRLKTQDARLANMAVHGAGLSPWESDVLVQMIQEVYFSNPADRPLGGGQLRYECVAAGEGAGKPIADCRLETVVLSLLHSDDRSVPGHTSCALRQYRIQRLTEEAREQGGLLSQEDLAQILSCHVSTIHRDVKALRTDPGIIVPTRGQQKDIGPGTSHKALVLKHWLQGKEPPDVARDTHHSLHAVERYIQHFSRVAFLKRKEFHPLQIALTVGISTAAVDTYLELYEKTHWKTQFRGRYEEIDLIGAQHYEAEDLKKGALSQSGKPRSERSRP